MQSGHGDKTVRGDRDGNKDTERGHTDAETAPTSTTITKSSRTESQEEILPPRNRVLVRQDVVSGNEFLRMLCVWDGVLMIVVRGVVCGSGDCLRGFMDGRGLGYMEGSIPRHYVVWTSCQQRPRHLVLVRQDVVSPLPPFSSSLAPLYPCFLWFSGDLMLNILTTGGEVVYRFRGCLSGLLMGMEKYFSSLFCLHVLSTATKGSCTSAAGCGEFSSPLSSSLSPLFSFVLWILSGADADADANSNSAGA